MKKFSDSVIKTETCEYLKTINIPSLLIYSPTSESKTNLLSNLNDNITIISTHEITKEVKTIDNYLINNRKFECVIGFGGGTALDIAKYISYSINSKLICIPSMLSTNVYSTDKVSMNVNGDKKTLFAKLPDIIIYDDLLLDKSLTENLYGFADIFSIHTALKDWNIAKMHNNEIIDDKIFDMATELLNDAINYVLNTDYKKVVSDTYKLFEFIGNAGHITNLYGTGRPESGSEHIFAKELEQQIEVPHAIAVSIGILIMSLYQSNYSKKIEYSITKMKILNTINKYPISRELVMKILKNLHPRNDRFSIINIIDPSDVNIDEILTKLNIK